MTPIVTSFLAALPSETDVVAMRDGARWIVGTEPDAAVATSGAGAFAALRALRGWWAGWLTYDLGRAVERVVERPRAEPPGPDLVLARFDARAVIEPDRGTIDVVGDGPARRTLETARRAALDVDAPPFSPATLPAGEWRTGIERDAYEAAVRAVIELIRAGDCYQVNLTRRITSDDRVDPSGLFCALVDHNPAPHAALARLGGVGVVSASPERFLRLDARRVVTRPIKGTARGRAALAASAKDRAENVMIVDLARNDLGRVCEFGSIAVPSLCELEAHPGLFHLASTVTGTLREGVGVADLLAATFPPASITGAPKPRVMQIIEDLEPVRRGVYCGALGWFDLTGPAPVVDLNVAIRTFTVTADATHLGVGGGVVADSDPASEWDETVLKASRLLEVAGAGALVPS